MSALPSLAAAEFGDFFEAVHGHSPFPWQRRLAHLVVDEGWPAVLDLPTGTGKTAVVDVAVFALAVHAGREPVPDARRIVFVVDRRTIVDQAFERARRIRDALSSPVTGVVQRVRERLASLSVEGRPLDIALMRGGVARDDGWARAPDQPVIAVSTVDQVGSRLLFRGYGVTDGMKPVHAGLLGHDVLYLLDEVHLSQPFKETLAAIGSRYREWREHPLPGGFHVVEMSATPGAEVRAQTFTLDADDQAHHILATRLTARKPAALVQVSATKFQQELEIRVRGMLDAAKMTIAVVVNRVASARECHARLLERLSSQDVDVHLLTGRMRPYDRDGLEARVFSRIKAGRERRPDDRPVVIVATQSIEAGADFDFDGLVTECASLDALRQRFGRLDRLGAIGAGALGAVVARTDTLKDDAVYGDALGATWRWLERVGTNGIVDFGLDVLPLPGGEELPALLAPRAHAPVLLPSHLDAWVQTAPMPDPDPDISLWLHGPKRGQADVQVVWRADLDETLLLAAVDESGVLATTAQDLAVDIVEAIRPSAAEAMPVPFVAVRRWLLGLPEPDSPDLEGAPAPDEDETDSPSRARPAVLWQSDSSRVIRALDLRPGQTIVVPAAYGGILHANWAPTSTDPVGDVAEAAAWRNGRAPALRLHPLVLAQHSVPPPRLEATDAEALQDLEIVQAWLEALSANGPTLPFSDVIEELLRNARSVRVERLPLAPAAAVGEYLVVRGRLTSGLSGPFAEGETGTDDGSTSSFTGAMVTLAAHTDGVVRAVEGYARRLALPEAIARDMRTAAAWHDAGKADVRFQRWLHGGSEFKALAQPELLAKSQGKPGRAARRAARQRAGYPEGTRHELMSVALLEAAGDARWDGKDRALIGQLIASHHGHCRPFAPWVPDPLPVEVAWNHDGVVVRTTSAHQLARLDSGVADRFWRVVRRYGWWGAAWLEAVFRLADHRQSERERTGGGGA